MRVYDSFAGEEFILSEIENTIGRTDENFILLSDPSISRHHAKLLREGDRYTVIDLQSSNGTEVNERPVHTPQPLSPGDVVKFGNVSFVFAEGDAQISPQDYTRTSSTSGSRVVRLGVVAILLLCGVALGGSLLYALFSNKQHDQGDDRAGTTIAQEADDDIPLDPIEARAQEIITKAERAEKRGDWSQAMMLYTELDRVTPNDPRRARGQGSRAARAGRGRGAGARRVAQRAGKARRGA